MAMSTLTLSLVALAEAYAEARGVSLWRVGHLAAGAGGFFVHLRSGGKCTTHRYEHALQWFAENWPESAAWPADIQRPAPRPEGEAA